MPTNLSLDSINKCAASNSYFTNSTTTVTLGFVERLVRAFLWFVPLVESSAKKCQRVSVETLQKQIVSDITSKGHSVPADTYAALRGLNIPTIRPGDDLYPIRHQLAAVRALAFQYGHNELATGSPQAAGLVAERDRLAQALVEANTARNSVAQQLSETVASLSSVQQQLGNLSPLAQVEMDRRAALEEAAKPVWMRNVPETEREGVMESGIVFVPRDRAADILSGVGASDRVVLPKGDKALVKSLGNKAKVTTYSPSKTVATQKTTIRELNGKLELLTTNLAVFNTAEAPAPAPGSSVEAILVAAKTFMSSQHKGALEAANKALAAAKQTKDKAVRATEKAAANLKLQALRQIKDLTAAASKLEAALVKKEGVIQKKLTAQFDRATASVVAFFKPKVVKAKKGASAPEGTTSPVAPRAPMGVTYVVLDTELVGNHELTARGAFAAKPGIPAQIALVRSTVAPVLFRDQWSGSRIGSPVVSTEVSLDTASV
ncbi:MAG: hypothetical protein H0X51_09800 [Parachlamydiaceae bacterium]|nr:hypothetical protein [Parachlamydiaceae bacterium]